jgi:hypothetical protein
MNEPTEVRLVPMSREQRDMLVGASKTRWPEFSALVAAWDAAEPGVLSGVEEARWLRSYAAEVQREARLGEWPEDYAGVVLDMLARSATLLERAAAGGEAAAACPVCSRPIVEHSSEERKACHDACSGFQRSPAGGERPSVSLRETIETHLRANEWEDKDGYWFWRNSGLGIAIEYAVGHQLKVEREAEGKNAMSERMMKDWTS